MDIPWDLILLMVRHGSLRDGLRAMFSTIPNVSVVCTDDKNALEIAAINTIVPRLLFIDSNMIYQGKPQLIVQLKRLWPQAYILVLIDEVRQHAALLNLGANDTVILGMATDLLYQRVIDALKFQSPLAV
jgi:DNA-binding NarL/FixJ family response regulator